MRRRDIVFVLMILGVVLIIFSEVIFTPLVFFIRDILNQFWPWRSWAAENIQRGIFPLWNPYNFCGMPFFANLQSALFYPGTIFFYLFGFVLGYKAYLVMHFFLAGFFTWLLARSFRLRLEAALVCGIVFMGCGSMITRVEFPPALGTCIWLPLLFLQMSDIPEGQAYGASRYRMSDKDWHLASGTVHRLPITGYQSPVLLGIVLAMAFLAGHPQFMFYALVALVFYAIFSHGLLITDYRLSPYGRSAEGRPITTLFLAGLVGISLSLMQFLPGWELIQHTARQAGLDFSEAITVSLHPKEFLSFFYPFLFGKVAYSTDWAGSFWVRSFYVGIVSLFLAGVAVYSSIVHRPSSIVHRPSVTDYRLPFVGLLILSLLLAMGKHTPVYGLVYRLFPPIRMMRNVAFVMWLADFSLAILAGFGMVYIHHRLTQIFTGKKIIYTNLCLWGIIGIIAGDLILFDWKINPTIHKQFFPQKTEVAELLQKDKDYFRFFLDPATQKGKYDFGKDTFSAWLFVKDKLIANVNLPYHLFNVSGLDALSIKEVDDTVRIFSTKERDRLSDLFNVKYILMDKKLPGKDYELIHPGQINLYENRDYFPRVFLATEDTETTENAISLTTDFTD